jgi:hypothetical protein
MTNVTAFALLMTTLMQAAPGEQIGKEQVKRGEYLVRFGGCHDCHTPWKLAPPLDAPAPDMTRMLSGHPEGALDPQGAYRAPDIAVIGPTFTSFRLPFGIVYSPNLTPDRDTGLGSWTEAMFVRAFRTGKHMGGEGRIILPPMPWQQINALTDSDLKAVFAYLRSIPPIRNAVPSPKVAPEVIAKMTETARKAATTSMPSRRSSASRPR